MMPPAPPPPARGLRDRVWNTPSLLLVVATLSWSGNFVVGRAVHETVPPVALAFWRWTLGLALVLVLARRRLLPDLPALRRAWRSLALLALLGVAAFNTLVYLGLGSTTAVNGLLLQSTMPLLIIVFAFAAFGERVRPMQVLAVQVSLAGVVVIAARGSLQSLLALSFNRGDGLILLAVACYAVYSVWLRRRPRVHPLSFLAATFALGVLMLLPAYAWEHLRVRPLRVTAPAVAAVAYVAVVPSVLAYLCFNRAVELAGANRAGQFLHLMPVFGSILAVVFLGEQLRGYHLAGAAMIGLGLVMARRAPGNTPSQTTGDQARSAPRPTPTPAPALEDPLPH